MSTMTVDENKERLEKLKTDKKFLNKAFWAYNWSIPMNFTRERMLGCSMTAVMCRIADDLYPNDIEKQKELARNHAVFFNTQQGLGAVIYGIMVGMELERAETDEIPNTLIQSIKQALAGPLAGLGDSLIQALLTPIIISIGIGMSQNTGSLLGPIFMFVAYSAFNWFLSYSLFKAGFKYGVVGAEKLLDSNMKDRLIPALEALGIIVIGGVLASMMNVKTGLVFTAGEMTIDFQTDVFDAFIPKILSLIEAMIVYYLIKYKHMSATKVMLWMIPVAIIGYFTHILA